MLEIGQRVRVKDENPGPDDRRGVVVGFYLPDWVEVLHDTAQLMGDNRFRNFVWKATELTGEPPESKK